MPANVTVREYDPKAARDKAAAKSAEKWIISPLTGERVPADRLADHMRLLCPPFPALSSLTRRLSWPRYNTVDSQYYEKREREREAADAKAPVYAPGVDISSNIKAFAERRSDIFGVGEKGAAQTIIGKRIDEEDRDRERESERFIHPILAFLRGW